jgi:hypothetical protein
MEHLEDLHGVCHDVVPRGGEQWGLPAMWRGLKCQSNNIIGPVHLEWERRERARSVNSPLSQPLGGDTIMYSACVPVDSGRLRRFR